MQKEIFVTGLGLISAIGNTTEDCLDALKKGKTGIGAMEILDTVHKDTFKVGEIKKTNQELCSLAGLNVSELKNFTRTGLLGLIAAKEALQQSSLQDKSRIGLISSTTVGGMDKTELDIANPNATNDYILTHACGDSTNKICQQLELESYRTTISTACSSGTNAIIHGIKLIKAGIIDQAIVGGVDALSKFTLNGFNALMIFDKDWCKPFDRDRMGLNLGEAAGFIVIESAESAQKRGKKAICKVTGYANTNDAYHQTASSPEGDGAFSAMINAIKMSGLSNNAIDYINVHGTGTNNNDLSEGVALKRVFGENVPKFSSTKAYTGHTLGAAAGVEAVFSALSIQHGVIYPNLNFSNPIEEINLTPQLELELTEVNNVLSNSFGFGGNNSSVIFSK